MVCLVKSRVYASHILTRSNKNNKKSKEESKRESCVCGVCLFIDTVAFYVWP